MTWVYTSHLESRYLHGALDGKKRRCKYCKEGNCCYADSKSLVPENIIQGDSGGKFKYLRGGGSIGHCEE